MQYPRTHPSKDVFSLELTVSGEEKNQQRHHVEKVQHVSEAQGCRDKEGSKLLRSHRCAVNDTELPAALGRKRDNKA